MAWGNKSKGGKGTAGERAGAVSFDSPAPSDASTHDHDAPEDVIDEQHDHASVGDVDAVPSTGVGASDSAVPGFGPATTRFGRSGSDKAPKGRVKPAKPAKVRKPSKDDVRAVEDYPMPVMMVIEFYEGLTKEREAEQLARAMIEKNFDAPNASYVYTQKWKNGIAVEIQEGGGQAYLPEILQKLDEDPAAIIAVPMSNRIAQVRLDSETGRLEMLLLLNNQEPPADSFVPLPSRPMKPFDRRGSRLFIAGVALLASSFVASVFAVGSFFIDTEAWALPYLQQTEVKLVPMSQLAQMKEAAAKGDCLYKMEYAGGAWTMTTGYNSDGKCAKDRSAMAPIDPVLVPGATVDGIPPAAGAPVAGAPIPGAPVGAAGVPVGGALPPPPGAPIGATPPVTAVPQPAPAG